MIEISRETNPGAGRFPSALAALLLAAGAMTMGGGAAIARDPAPMTPIAGAGTTAQADDPDMPLQILVSLDDQKLEVYRGTKLIETTRISSGKRGHGTPTGVFSILEKRRRHFSNLYNNAPMPYMQRLTWSGIALHEGVVPNYPASHGCIRMPRAFAQQLFSMTDRGAHVIVTRKRAEPRSVTHAALPALRLAETEVASLSAELRPGLPGAVTDGEAGTVGSIGPTEPALQVPSEPLRILVTPTSAQERLRDMQRVLDRLGYDPGPADGVMGRKTRAAIRLFQEGAELPVTGEPTDLVLRALYADAGEAGPATGRLYVRRNFKEIYSANVVLKDPDQPLGTHLFTAIAGLAPGAEPRWMTVVADEAENRTPEAVLDRIEWTPEARAFVEENLALGSSLMVTDRPFRLHSGLGTDFVVMTRQ
ncbi:L,D-transpeptidase family protein [Stappia indica]|uniref:L,D-transpeptidase family protein n=1 Tax=Stappia indica TaxID=538381 RepID=UPI001D1873A8|nr:L,D-transpeptidase [Stappia indica]MCC4244023.1 L,D-transpeptidase [Stappia indica]